MKLITNLVPGLNRAALAEGMAFAEALVSGEQDNSAIIELLRKPQPTLPTGGLRPILPEPVASFFNVIRGPLFDGAELGLITGQARCGITANVTSATAGWSGHFNLKFSVSLRHGCAAGRTGNFSAGAGPAAGVSA